jgi:hypothetical protein
MNSLFLFSTLSYATPALRQEIKSLIDSGNCEKAVRKSEVWEEESSRSWKHWNLRVKALECVDAPIDRIYYAYRMYLWYGGKKTETIKKRIKELYPSLYDLRVTISPPKSLRFINPNDIILELSERPWAPFEKEKGKNNEYLAQNLLPDTNTLVIRAKDPRVPIYSIPIPATANTEYEVVVNWPKATIVVPKSDPRISAKVYLPNEDEGREYKEGQKIKTIAGNITIEPQLDNLGTIKIQKYNIKVPKGRSNLPLPWGYEVFYDDKLIEREVFGANKEGIFREDITIPIQFGIETLKLPSTLEVTPQFGVIQKFSVRGDVLPLGTAHNNIAKAQKALQKQLKPQLYTYGAALALFFASSTLEGMAQNSALKAQRTDLADEYSSEVLKAKLFRTSSIATFLGGGISLGLGLRITFDPAKTIIENLSQAQKERKNIKDTVINLNEHLVE